MKTYLVGGAVRDRLLGLSVVDRDYVVVGGTAEEMIAADFLPVGKDFPVFLHPKSKEEYALARTERKTAKGYHGFTFHADPDVTLEEDLQRRDLTINAIAEDEDGQLIDPYGGQQDLNNRVLRHVSNAFLEDPVRILRVARFKARYASFGFLIADETLELMKTMVRNGEAEALVAERIWQELHKTLILDNPTPFFDALRACGALAVIFPEVDALFGVPQPAKWHPEIDTGVHTMMVLQQACKLTQNPATRFAALCHDLGKALTPPDAWPSHTGHEESGARLTKELCSRLRAPAEYRDLAVLVARYHTHVHRSDELKATTLTSTLESLDVLRKSDRFEQFLIACEADARGRTGFENTDYPQADYFRAAATAFKRVNAKEIAAAVVQSGGSSETIKQRVHQERVNAVKQIARSDNS